MSLLDSEASEASDSEEDIIVSKSRDKKRNILSNVDDDETSDEEELINEDEICRKEGQGWIVDEDEGGESSDQESSDGSGKEDDKLGDEEEDEDEGLDDEDFQLIQENVGIDLKKKKKRRLVLEDDEDDEQNDGGSKIGSKHARRDLDSEAAREAVAREIFDDDDDDLDATAADESGRGDNHARPPPTANLRVTDDEDEEEDEDDMGDFIVDDRTGQPQVPHTNRQRVHTDAALQRAQDIFGVDFDLAEFEASRRELDTKPKTSTAAADVYSESEEDDLEDDYLDADKEESASRRRRKRQSTKSGNRARRQDVDELLDDRVFELFDPNDLEQAYYSRADERIRRSDIPERFLLRQPPVVPIDPSLPGGGGRELKELPDEAEWIYRHGFKDLSTEASKSVDITELVERLAKTTSITSLATDQLTGRQLRQRQARSTTGYEVAERAGLGRLVERFGLSAAHFGENVQDQYAKHDVDQCPMLPENAAEDFLCRQFADSQLALAAARYMLAFQVSREPYVRRSMRHSFRILAVISSRPTARGRQEIDESHPLYRVKYLHEKPVSEFNGSFLFLQLHNASVDKLITYDIHLPSEKGHSQSLIDGIMHYFHRDEFSSLVQAWNEQRHLVLKQAADEFIVPILVRELREKMLESSQEVVLRLCAKKLFDQLAVAPYPSDGHRNYDTEEEGGNDPLASSRATSPYPHHQSSSSRGGDKSSSVWSKSARVLALAVKDEDGSRQSLVAACQLDSTGQVVDFLHLHNLLIPTNRGRNSELARANKESDMQRLSTFIVKHRPHVIVMGCDCRGALPLQDQLQGLVDDLASDRRLLTRVHVELADTEPAIVWSQSQRASSDLPASYTPLLKQAVSLGRRMQDPLAELAQLVNGDQDILAIRWHSLQDCLPRDALLRTLEIEFINRVNEVGVDVNRCLSHPHTANLLQFVSGLGPRKALFVLRTLKHKKKFLTNRTQTVTKLELGPHVMLNSTGFIKIDTDAVREGDVEILDSTRVHPESYELAKKMAVDALEYDEANLSDALCDIVKSPIRLRELDLDAFADELRRQDRGDKRITLYDIRKELNHRYHDYRQPYHSPNPEAVFSMVTHETPESFHVGRLVECRVVNVAVRLPKPDELEQANPTRSNTGGSGLWKCPFCQQDDFESLSNVWAHFDSGQCPGQVTGIRTRLDNGIAGFVPLRFIDPPTDKFIADIQPGSLLRCRVTKIDIAKFNVELTCKESDIKDDRRVWSPSLDTFYNHDKETEDDRADQEARSKAKTKSTPYTNRVIFHPYFKNIGYNKLVRLEPSLELGAIVIRPSSKGPDHLTVSWKVDNGILQHIDVLEREKVNHFSLGKLLLIGEEEFEDLDEIVARYVQPMASWVRDLMSYRYYRDSAGGDRNLLTSYLHAEKAINSDRIPYFLSSTKQYPGHFLLAYMPNQTPKFEFLSVRPEGFRFRRRIFPSIDYLITWFKEHYNDAANFQYQ